MVLFVNYRQQVLVSELTRFFLPAFVSNSIMNGYVFHATLRLFRLVGLDVTLGHEF